jgi:hypothetical protein
MWFREPNFEEIRRYLEIAEVQQGKDMLHL